MLYQMRKFFSDAAPPYQRALKESGYDHVLKFEPPPPQRDKNRGKEKLCGSTPPTPWMFPQILVPDLSRLSKPAFLKITFWIKSLIKTQLNSVTDAPRICWTIFLLIIQKCWIQNPQSRIPNSATVGQTKPALWMESALLTTSFTKLLLIRILM